MWGEDCRHKRHFDCDSFVNYVLSHATKTSWGYTAEQYVTGSHPDHWSTVDLSAPPVAGDILLRGGEGRRHVALLGADNHVYQAEQHDTGVHADEIYGGKNWRQRLRILDSLIG